MSRNALELKMLQFYDAKNKEKGADRQSGDFSEKW
jgi:hypothetical protein